MKAPAFWSRPRGLAAMTLAPIGWLYGRIAAWRMARPGARAGIPVVCIGNFTAGGAGKTPAALLAAARLAQAGRRPVFLSRGYGGRLAGPVLVDPARHAAADCGDEPLLLAAAAPAIVARDRVAGAAAAEARGAGVIVMDDGMQNPSLAKDVVIAVVDAEAGIGNGLCLPAGPLRAPLSAQLRQAAALLLIGSGAAGEAVAATASAAGLQVLRGSLRPDPAAVAALQEKGLLAFAGIGRPAKFFRTLEEAGLDVRRRRDFPDHHAYSPAEAEALLREARDAGLTLVTTAKDQVRWPAAAARPAVLSVTLVLEAGDEARFDALLSARAPSAT